MSETVVSTAERSSEVPSLVLSVYYLAKIVQPILQVTLFEELTSEKSYRSMKVGSFQSLVMDWKVDG
jgi:hypothetical protein